MPFVESVTPNTLSFWLSFPADVLYPGCPVPYLKSSQNTSPEGRFIGCTDKKSCDDTSANTRRTKGSAIPAHSSLPWTVPVRFASSTNCPAWFSSNCAMLPLCGPFKPSSNPVRSHFFVNSFARVRWSRYWFFGKRLFKSMFSP